MRFGLLTLLSFAVSCGPAEEPSSASTSSSSSSSTGGGGEGAGGAGGESAAELRIMTWNLEHFPKSAQTIGRIGEILSVVQPDVVGVQEIDDLEAWEDLDASLEDYRGITASSGDGFARVGLLYHEDRVFVGDVETLFGSDSYAFPRAVLKAHLKLASDPTKDVIFGVIHLKAMLDDESVDRRREACQKLAEYVLEAENNGLETEFVLAGDFNDKLLDSPQWNVFGPLLDPETGTFLTLPLEQAGEYTYLPFESFIDHVFVRGGALSKSVAEVVPADTMVASYESSVSDHVPVVATLTFAP